MNKKSIKFLSFILFIVLSCSTNLKNQNSEIVLGINKKNKKIKINIDSLYIVTPAIEISSYYNNKPFTPHYNKPFTPDYVEREKITNFIIDTEKSILKNKDHFELAIMKKDYLTINKIFEGPKYIKYLNPKFIVRANDDILIKEKKYTLLISLCGYYGDINRYVLYINILNNKNKTYEKVDRYEYEDSPLDFEKLEKRVLSGIKKNLIY